MASPTPVFPLVGSTMVPPGWSRPSSSAASDHGERDAVLRRAPRVEQLELGDERALEVAGGAVQADHGRVADELDEGVGHVHGRPGVGDTPDLDTGQRGDGVVGNALVGEQLGGQSGPAQPGRHRRRLGHRPPHPHPAGDAGPQRADERGQRFVGAKSMDVQGPVFESGGGRFSADYDEHIHNASLL